MKYQQCVFMKDTIAVGYVLADLYSLPSLGEYLHNDLQTETGQIHFVFLKL